jgi:hypothetical protein
MSKNTKHKFYKEYLKLLTRRSEIYKAQNALGYVELEKPYQYGFNAYLTLREDVFLKMVCFSVKRKNFTGITALNLN